jgi:hypothetical protein
MKYLYSFLILVSALTVIFGLVWLGYFLKDKFFELDWKLRRKYKKYSELKEKVSNISCITFAILMAIIFIICFVFAYIEILNHL